MSNQEVQKKKNALAAMLAGTKTKESEAVRIKTKLYEDKNVIHSVDPRMIEESLNTNYRSASELSREELTPPNARGLPPVGMNDIEFLLGGAKGKKPQQPVNEQKSQNKPLRPAPMGYDEEKEIPNNLFNTTEIIMEKLKNKPLASPLSKKTPLINENYTQQFQMEFTEQIANLVENLVYDILGELVETANQNLINKEQIKIQIGESLFIGKLSQALKKPVKKK